MSSDNNSTSKRACGACKILRRKCVTDCVFAAYFDSEEGAAHFGAVHKIFRASNVSKLLQRIPANKRHDAVLTLCYEAEARLRDPVYGCVSHIFDLQQEVLNLQAELACMQNFLSSLYQLRCQTTLLGQASFNTHQQQQSRVMFNSQHSLGLQSGNVDFQALAQELLSRDFRGVSGNVDFQALAQELLLSMEIRGVVNLQAELAHQQNLLSSFDHDLLCQPSLGYLVLTPHPTMQLLSTRSYHSSQPRCSTVRIPWTSNLATLIFKPSLRNSSPICTFLD